MVGKQGEELVRPAKKKAASKKNAQGKKPTEKIGNGNGETEIEAGLGFTISIGDYQSARVDARVRKTIQAITKKDVDEGFSKLWGVVEEQTDNKIAEILELYRGDS